MYRATLQTGGPVIYRQHENSHITLFCSYITHYIHNIFKHIKIVGIKAAKSQTFFVKLD